MRTLLLICFLWGLKCFVSVQHRLDQLYKQLLDPHGSCEIQKQCGATNVVHVLHVCIKVMLALAMLCN